MTEPIPDELRALYASERDVSAADRAAIRTRLEASVAAPAAGAVASKALWLAVAGVVVAGAIYLLATRERAAVPAAPESPMVATPVETDVEVNAPVQEPSVQEPPVQKPPPSVRQPAPVPSQADLLARAWEALAKRDIAVTLKILDDDRRLHPDGALTEEREAMRVQALLAASRTQEARTHAEQFLAKWPRSVHRKVMEKALAP